MQLRNLFVLGVLTLSTARAETFDVTIDGATSSNTLEWPEVHLLFHNNEDVELDFLRASRPTLRCGSGDELRIFELESSSFWPDYRTGQWGTIPASGWNHRTFRFGANSEIRRHLPCIFQVSFRFGRNRMEHHEGITFEVPKGMIPRDFEPPEFGTLVAGTLVEQLAGGQTLLLRIYLQNTRQSGITVRQKSREISCPHASRPAASWDLSTLVRQGEDGPVYIPGGSWGVLLETIRIDDQDAYDQCSARLELYGGGEESTSIDIPLLPESRYGPLIDHPPPPSDFRN